ncbi:MAG: right-handed parallel beta-helix repeat-containing protein [Clostridia bacterium]|nr:right-handed parallel beta-helix repeat-containing protein [Clostridia bacterium]
MKKLKLLGILLSVLLAAGVCSPAVFAVGEKTGSTAIYVSPFGDDTASGAKEAPLATLAGAKEKAKTISGEGEVIVYFAEGSYYIDETVSFDSSDRQNVTYTAAKGAKVVFSGAYPVTGFKTEKVNGVRVFTKDLQKGDPLLEAKSLFRDGERLRTPRFPAEGYLEVGSVNTDDSIYTDETTPWEFTTCQTSFNAKAGDIPKEVFDVGKPTVRILHYWHDEMAFAESFDSATGRVKLSRPSTMRIQPGDRYYFENVFSEMNEPGEWYLDAEGRKLYYVPEDSEDPASVRLSASAVTKLVDINSVSDITFENIVFECTDWELAVAKDNSWHTQLGMDSSQAAYDVEGVFTSTYAKQIHIIGCEFRNLGGTAIKFYEGSRYCSVENCVIRDVAATGVFVGGPVAYDDDPSYTGDILINNNLIYNYGRVFFNAVGVQYTHAGNVSVTHNEIHDGYYTAVSGGWSWSYASSGTRNNDISYNLIYNIGQGWLSDMGGIYTLDKQPGTKITHNVIHNVACDPGQGGYGGWGIYLDEGSSDMLIEKNLVFCCSSQGLNIHYGEGNVFRNNISALNAAGQVSVGTRPAEPHATAFYYNNIFLTDNKAPIYVCMASPDHFCDSGNLMWDLSHGKKLYFSRSTGVSDALSLRSAESQGYLHHVTTAAPMFADPESFDFTLNAESPALALNFEPWDYSEAGTIAGTTVGLSVKGGETAYNAGAEALEIEKGGAGFGDLLRNTALALAALLIIAAAVLGCIRLYRQGKQMITALTVLVMIAIGAGMYQYFVYWSPVRYSALLVLFAPFGAFLPTLLLETNDKRVKVKKGVFFAVCAIVLFALMSGLCFLLNNVLRIGEPKAISLTLLFGAALTTAGLFLKLKKREKKEKNAAAETAEEEASENEE